MPRAFLKKRVIVTTFELAEILCKSNTYCHYNIYSWKRWKYQQSNWL